MRCITIIATFFKMLAAVLHTEKSFPINLSAMVLAEYVIIKNPQTVTCWLPHYHTPPFVNLKTNEERLLISKRKLYGSDRYKFDTVGKRMKNWVDWYASHNHCTIQWPMVSAESLTVMQNLIEGKTHVQVSRFLVYSLQTIDNFFWCIYQKRNHRKTKKQKT